VSRPTLPEVTSSVVDDAFYVHPEAARAALARLRTEAPVAWDAGIDSWVVATHADVLEVSKDPGRFCSRHGVMYSRLDLPVPEVPGSLLTADPPWHTIYRKVAQPAFAPSRIRSMEPKLRAYVRDLIAPIEPGEPFEFVGQISVPFPLIVLAELLGVPAQDWAQYRVWVDAAVNASSQRQPPEELTRHIASIYAFLGDKIDEYRDREPDESVLSLLHRAEIDGRGLTRAEHLMYLVQFFIAGNDTTRNLISGGLVALAEHPEQYRALRADPSLMASAVEEMLRWTTPVLTFFRTATRDTELRGQTIAQGEHLVLAYLSANFDAEVFGPQAETFDVTRHPNPHLAFGFGAHYCLGAMLARLEGRILFEELTARFNSVELVEPVERNPSHLIAGINQARFVFS
jgi:cytochrome P450